MRKLFFAILFLLAFCTTVLASTEHIVRKGEILSGIAKTYGVRYQEIASLNKLADPNLIRVGRKLAIPEKGQASERKRTDGRPRAAVRLSYKDSGDGYMAWRRVNAAPYGQRDPRLIIDSFNVPSAVRSAFNAAALYDGPYWTEVDLEPGEVLVQMASYPGRPVIEHNVKVQQTVRARVYRYSYGGQIYELVRPLVCTNWSWRLAGGGQQHFYSLLKRSRSATPASSRLQNFQPRDTCCYSQETWAYAGIHTGEDFKGYSRFAGLENYIWDCGRETDLGVLYVGGKFKIIGYDGEAPDGFRYHGNKWALGPAVKLAGHSYNPRGFMEENWVIRLAVMAMEQNDYGKIDAYKAHQFTRKLAASLTGSVRFSPDSFFKKLDGWLDAEYDYYHSKHSSWEGRSIRSGDDPAEDKSEIAIGMRGTVWQGEKLQAGPKLSVHHAFGSEATRVAAGPWIGDIGDQWKLGAEGVYTFGSKYEQDNGYGMGITLDVDLTKLVDKAWNKVGCAECRDSGD